MAIIGVVCEYNPFHNGHRLHLEQSRMALGGDSRVICVMSGDFVQRGEPAVYSKYARAEAACRCGADLVIELPLPWVLSSAEGFARGAVGLLNALGATHLCFGSETGELEPLERLAQALLEPGVTAGIKNRLAADGSLSYAAARELVIRERFGETAELLRQPNNILGVEYCKAIYDLRLGLEPLPILRRGAAHDGASAGAGMHSAMELRKRLYTGKSLAGAVPREAEEVFSRERSCGRELADRSVLELPILSRLRMLGEREYQALPDGGDGLGTRLYRAVRQETGLDAILAAAKTKRYALSRLRRMCLCACLGIRAGEREEIPPYARVLAANQRGRELLHRLSGRAAVPILTKPASVRELSRDCRRVFEQGADAHDFYVLGYSVQAERRPGADWRTGPKILDK